MEKLSYQKTGDGDTMNLDRSVHLAFFSKSHISHFVKELFDANHVKAFLGADNTTFYLAFKRDTAVGVLVVEKDDKDPNMYLAKALYPNGDVSSFVIFLGEKLITNSVNLPVGLLK